MTCRSSGRRAVYAALSGFMLVAGAQARIHGESALAAYNNNASLAFIHSHVEYGERLSPPNGAYFDTDSGFVEGGRFAVSGMRTAGVRNVYFHVSYSQTDGTLNYVGAIESTNTTTGVTTSSPLSESQNTQMTDIGLRLGQGFMVANRMMLIPYIGYGFHHWGRGQSASVTAPYNLYEGYRNQYAAFGFLWQVELFRRLVTSLNLAYGRTIHPTVSAPALGLAEGLGPKPWRRAGVDVDYLIGRHEAVFVSATFTEFQYGAGPVIVGTTGYVGNEPFSQTEVTNYAIGARFLF